MVMAVHQARQNDQSSRVESCIHRRRRFLAWTEQRIDSITVNDQPVGAGIGRGPDRRRVVDQKSQDVELIIIIVRSVAAPTLALSVSIGICYNRDVTAAIPIIDFQRYDADRPATLRDLANEVDEALSTIGFMAIRNLGIKDALIDEVFGASQAFFHADAGTKRRSAYMSAAENFGYQGIAQENLDPSAPADLKETFTMRDVLNKPPDDDRWPSPAFRSLMSRFYARCLEAAFRLQRVLAVALNTEADFFTRCHSGENVTLRLLHYPTTGVDAVQSGQLGAGAHTDYGLLTLLFQSGVGGLEVQAADGTWQAVNPDPDAVVINSGDLLEIWTNGRYRSTPHRVQPKIGGAERQSIAMFVDPDSDTEVTALWSCITADNPPRFSPTTAGKHLQERIEASHKARFAS